MDRKEDIRRILEAFIKLQSSRSVRLVLITRGYERLGIGGKAEALPPDTIATMITHFADTYKPPVDS
jgi:hypothetical protein